MKVLFTMTPAFNPNEGGVQRTTFKLGKYFTESDHSVSYISLKNKGNIPAEYGRLFHVDEENGLENLTNLDFFKKTLDLVKPHIVINQMPYESKLSSTLFEEKSRLNFILLGCLRNSLFSVKNNIRDTSKRELPDILFPFFDNRIGLNFLFNLHRIKHKKQLKRILDIHDYYILLAPPNQNELEYFVGDYQKQKVLSIPNSIPEVFDNKSRKEKIILHVGRLNIPQKRSDLLTEFWQKVHEHLPDWKFVIVGDGPYRKTMEREISKQNLPRIILEGYQKPESYYENATFFMMPSAYEGFPNTVLEAQSYGCIPLAYESYAVISWIVNEGKDALLCTPFNSAEMAQRLIQVADKQETLEKMQKACYINAGRFTIDKVGKIWLNFFEKIISK